MRRTFHLDHTLAVESSGQVGKQDTMFAPLCSFTELSKGSVSRHCTFIWHLDIACGLLAKKQRGTLVLVLPCSLACWATYGQSFQHNNAAYLPQT